MTKTVFALTAMLFLLANPIDSILAQSDNDVSFRWAFFHRSLDGKKEVIDFKKRPPHTVASGDNLQVYIQPSSIIYIYIFLLDTQKELFLIFPERPDFYAKRKLEPREIYIPSRYDWFTWDEARGTERFYILASSRRLKRLEEKTARYLDSEQDKALKADLLEEIELIRKQKSDLTTVTEKPVAIAGTIKSRGTALDGMATLVEARDFYAKTLRLKHE